MKNSYSTTHIIIGLICCMLAFVECPTLYAATALPPQFTFSSTSSFHTTGSYKAPTAAAPQTTSFRTISAFRGYSPRRTHTHTSYSHQPITSRPTPSISTNYRPSISTNYRPSISANYRPSISANYRSYTSPSTAPTYQSSRQRTHSYQGGTSAIATSVPAAHSAARSTTPHSANSTSIPTVSTTTLSHTSSSQPNSDLTSTSTTPQPSTTPNSTISNSTPQPATHLYHTFSALHSSASTSSTTIPTLPTIHKAGEVVWGNKLYDEDGNEIGYIDSEGKVWKDGNIIGTWHNGHFTTQGEPVQNPVGSPLCLLIFALSYFIYKRYQNRCAPTE